MHVHDTIYGLERVFLLFETKIDRGGIILSYVIYRGKARLVVLREEEENFVAFCRNICPEFLPSAAYPRIRVRVITPTIVHHRFASP